MTYTAGDAAAPVTDWVHDWDWLDDQWGPNAIAIWSSVREQCAMASTERYGRAFMPVTMEAVTPDRPRHRALLVGLGLRGPPRRGPPADAAHHVRPARAPRPPPPAAPVVQPEGDRAAGGRPADLLPVAHRRPGRRDDGRRRHPVRPAHPRPRDLHPAGRARGRRRPLPRLDLPELPAGAAGQPRARPGQRRDDRVHLGPAGPQARRARRRPPDAHRPRRDRRGARRPAARRWATSS